MYGWDRFARCSFVIYSIAEYHLAPNNVRAVYCSTNSKVLRIEMENTS